MSGFVIQQRTVQSLHTTLRPQPPIPLHPQPVIKHEPSNPHATPRRLFGGLRDRTSLQSALKAHDEPFDWSKLAYAQLVRDHSEVCDAMIFLHALYRSKSPVPRLLLFPRKWLHDGEDDYKDTILQHSRALLSKASKIFRVILVPIDPVNGTSSGIDFKSLIIRLGLTKISQQQRKRNSTPLPASSHWHNTSAFSPSHRQVSSSTPPVWTPSSPSQKHHQPSPHTHFSMGRSPFTPHCSWSNHPHQHSNRS